MRFFEKALNKYKKLPVAAKASFAYLCMSMIQKGLAFITSPIYTRIMTSEEYGIVSVYFSTESILGTVAMFCLNAGCFDIAMQDYKDDKDVYVFSSVALSNLITIIFGIIVLVIFPSIGEYIGVSTALLYVMFINFLLQPAFHFWTHKERFSYNYKMPAIMTILSAVLSSVCAVAGVLIFKSHRIEARIIGALLPLIPFYLIYLIYVGYQARFKVNFKYWKFAFLFNLPLIPHYLSLYILNGSDRLMIARLSGESQAAYYSLAYNITAVLTMVWSAINSSMAPFLLDKYEKKDYKRASNTVLPILSIFAMVCVFIILIAPEALYIIGTTEYYEAVYVIPPIVGGIFFQSLYYVFTGVLYYYKKPQYVMFASISTALLNILLNYIFIKRFGYIAAGYTTLLCFMLQAVIDYIVSKRVVGQNVYDPKYIVVLSLIVLAISLASNPLYFSDMLRYVSICILIITIVIKKDLIIDGFKRRI